MISYLNYAILFLVLFSNIVSAQPLSGDRHLRIDLTIWQNTFGQNKFIINAFKISHEKKEKLGVHYSEIRKIYQFNMHAFEEISDSSSIVNMLIIEIENTNLKHIILINFNEISLSYQSFELKEIPVCNGKTIINTRNIIDKKYGKTYKDIYDISPEKWCLENVNE